MGPAGLSATRPVGAHHWRKVNGSWVVQQDGDLYAFATSGAGFAAVPNGVSWAGDYAFKASYLLQAGTLGFSFDATHDGRYYVSAGTDLISLVKEDAAGTKTVLTQAQAPASGQQHYITMAKKSGTIQVYVDKILWLSFQDDAPLAAGTIAVGSADGTTAWVDDVLVNKIGKALPPGKPAVEAVDPSQVVAPPDGGGGLDQLPESDEDLPDLPDNNLPDEIPQPTVTFMGRAEAGGGAGSPNLTVAPFTNVVLEWAVENAQAVFLDGAARLPAEDMVVSTRESARYELEVIGLDGVGHSYYVNVTVAELDGGGDDPALIGPDLSIAVSMTIEEGTTTVHVSVQIHNGGDQDVHGAGFRWYAHEQSNVLSKSGAYNVAAGQTVSLGFAYDYGQRGNMHWLATIDEDQLVPDVDRSNNVDRGAILIE